VVRGRLSAFCAEKRREGDIMTTVSAEVRGSAGLRAWTVWAGWALTALAVLVFVWSAYMKLTRQPSYVTEWARLGYPDRAMTTLAFVQLTCLALYLIPWTSVLGVVLLTGYLGGAISSYVRIEDAAFANAFQITTALLAWGGLYLREERLWSLLPFRKTEAH
jgi:hypothetical protein